MKILLQHKESGLYLKTLDSWVTCPGEAQIFPSTTQALRMSQRHRLSGVQLVLSFENDGAFVPIPLEGNALRVG